MDLHTGIKGRQQCTVTPELTAEKVGSGSVKVFATPMMVALIEKTCLMSVAPCLEAGQGTVGTHVDVTHTAATPVGMTVTAESELIEVERRRLLFRVSVRDERGPVGEGTHERFIIDIARFQAKADSK